MSQARPHDDEQSVTAADPEEPVEPAATVELVTNEPGPSEPPEAEQEHTPEQPESPPAEPDPAAPARAAEMEEDDPPFIDNQIWWDEGAPDQAQSPPQEPASSPAPASAQPAAPVTQPPRDETRALPAGTVLPTSRISSQRGLSAAAQRDVGRVRSVNQDSVFALLTTLPRESSDLSVGLFTVADGMGGHANGEVASRIAISTVARTVLADLVVPALAEGVTEALQPLIVSAVQEANRAIWERARSEGSDMGTTCTTALMLGHALYIAHVGDSRLYIRTPDGLRCLTTDHSAIGRLIQLGQLDESEAREHPMRSQLYRTVGQMPEVQVDFIYHQLGQATHLLLCSDGLWSMLDEAVLLDVLDNTLWPQDACRELIARANLAGGEDNIGVVVVVLPSI